MARLLWASTSSLSRLHDQTQTDKPYSVGLLRLDANILPDNTRHSQQTDIHALGGIRSHNPGKRLAADLRRREHGCWNRRSWVSGNLIYEGVKFDSCRRFAWTSPQTKAKITESSQRLSSFLNGWLRCLHFASRETQIFHFFCLYTTHTIILKIFIFFICPFSTQ
jgi:hypothetical protein